MTNTFLAANTANGFFSLFDEMTKRTDHKIFLIKGGPGTGKSSLMKKAARAASDKGMAVEQIHCSSDPDSLDGVWIKDIKLILLDATPPHSVDPRYPGVVEHILPLGEYWNRDKLKAHRKEIVDLSGRISGTFEHIYRLLQGAGQMQKMSQSIVEAAFQKEKAVASLIKFFRRQAILPLQKTGRSERRFISALSCKGDILYEDIFQDCAQALMIEENYECSHLILNLADRILSEMGYDRIRLLSSLQPDHIEHLVVPECSLAIVTKNNRLCPQSELPVVKKLSLKGFLDNDIISAGKNKLAFGKKMCKTLYDEVSALLASEKALHDELEQFYIEAMNFDALNDMTDKFILENIG